MRSPWQIASLIVMALEAVLLAVLRGADRLTAESLRAAETELADAEPVD